MGDQMTAIASTPRRLTRSIVCSGVIALAAALAVASAGAATLPNPCTLLAKLHAQTTIAKGHTVAVKLGAPVHTSNETSCSETIGKLSVGLIVGAPSANDLSVPHVVSESSVASLGTNATLVLGSPLYGGETNGEPLDYIAFYKSGVFVALTVSNGTVTKTALTALGVALYPRVR
jgi:hypothetical protein